MPCGFSRKKRRTVPSDRDVLAQLGGPLWVADLDGIILDTFGRGLDAEGLMREQIIGTSLHDWPDPWPFRYALHLFRNGHREPILVKGTGPFRRVEELWPIEDNGEFVAIGGYSAMEVGRVPRWRIWWWRLKKTLGGAVRWLRR